MKRTITLILAVAMAITGGLVVAAPAQAHTQTQALAIGDCGTQLSFGPFDSRIRWNSSSGYWTTGRYRSGYGNCDGVYIIHYGHFGPNGARDMWYGSYRIRTFTPDGVINYTGPWRSRPIGGVYYNIRPEISNGRPFEIHERATSCLLSNCASEHWPVFALAF